MTELYVGVRDGYTAAQIASETWRTRGTYRLPSYTSDEDNAMVKSGEDLFADYAHLVQPRSH